MELPGWVGGLEPDLFCTGWVIEQRLHTTVRRKRREKRNRDLKLQSRLYLISWICMLFSWLAIISRRGPYWADDVSDVINLHTWPLFRFWLMTESEGTWCHRPSSALINWLLPIMRKVFLKVIPFPIDGVTCMFINKPHAGIELSICMSQLNIPMFNGLSLQFIIEYVAGFLNHRPYWCARILQGNLLFWRFVLPCSDVRGHLIYRTKPNYYCLTKQKSIFGGFASSNLLQILLPNN